MEIHLIRHTAVNLEQGICYGQSDIDLRAGYLNDFKKIQLDSDYDLMMCSPLKRCTRMAEYFSTDFIPDDRIMEMNFGRWELKRWDKIPSEEIQPWYEDYLNISPPGGESLQEMNERVLDFWRYIQINFSFYKIAIVTHAGVIRLILKEVLGMPADKMFSIEIDYGKKTIIHMKDSLIKVTGINI